MRWPWRGRDSTGGGRARRAGRRRGGDQDSQTDGNCKFGRDKLSTQFAARLGIGALTSTSLLLQTCAHRLVH